VYAHPVERLDLAVVFSWADEFESQDPAYGAELADWMRRAEAGSGEGVPASAVPHVAADRPRHTEVQIRRRTRPA
jgi:hypothetical protein